jgi:two-component system sensor histidine kinase/response regulator
LSQLLRDLSINRKLNLLVIVSTTISLFLAGLGIIVLDLLLLKNSLVGDLKSQARLVANTVNVNLYLDSSFKSDEMTDIFSVNPTILEAALFDKDGKLVKDEVGAEGEALYQRDKTRKFTPPKVLAKESYGAYEDGTLVVLEPITYETDEGKEFLGQVFIRSDLSEFNKQISTHLKFLTVVFLASFGFAYLVSKKFQSFVADPIKSLAQKTADISNSGDYSLRQPKISEDEIGDLTDSFNEMLNAIEKRDQELSATLGELRQRDAELSLERDRAEQATMAKSEFLAHMSHEIRTPMNGIVGMTNIALKTNLTDSQREYLGAVKTSADSLLLVINEILDFSKIEAGHLELDPHPFDFEECLSGALKSVTLQAHLKNMELACVIDHELPRTLIGDPARLRQIVINLVGNALKFTKEGGVSVSVKVTSSDAEEVHLECRVKDTGIGIPKERQKSVFESFTQADSSTSRNFGGTGLGLTITALLVEMMGGKIWVESEVGEGSTFIFTIILGKTDAPDSALDLGVTAALKDESVWLICNDDLHAAAMTEMMASFGSTLRRFRAGDDLWTEAQKSMPAAVFADADLPGGGLRLLAELQEKGIENTGLLLRTSNLSNDMTHYRSMGIRGHLLKPMRRNELAELLLRWLAPQEAAKLFATEEEAQSRGFTALKVLVCDDNAINRQLGRILLEGFSCDVTEAESGEKVVELIKGGATPDILLLDIMMPGMDGFECTRVLREMEANEGSGKRLPIIALTAHALKGYEERCLEANMDGYLSKPIDEDKMFDVLARFSEGREIPVGTANRTDTTKEAEAPVQEPKAEDVKEPEAEQEELKIFDLEVSLKRVGGNAAILKAIVNAFLGASLTQLAEVEKAVSDGAAEALRFSAHTFKGTVLNFEARKTAATAQALEDMGARADLEGAPALVEELRVRYEELRAEMEKI